MHANTQIPKVIGYKRVAEVSKDDKDWNHAAEWDHAARFFWNTVVNHRSVCIGGIMSGTHRSKVDESAFFPVQL